MERGAELRDGGLEAAGLGVQILRELDEQLEELLRLLRRQILAGLQRPVPGLQSLEEHPRRAPCIERFSASQDPGTSIASLFSTCLPTHLS